MFAVRLNLFTLGLGVIDRLESVIVTLLILKRMSQELGCVLSDTTSFMFYSLLATFLH